MAHTSPNHFSSRNASAHFLGTAAPTSQEAEVVVEQGAVTVTRPQPVVHWTQFVAVGHSVVVVGSTVMLLQPQDNVTGATCFPTPLA